ncbi:hypothetical protein ASF13_18550 [Erwinia sp. Leaf53]|nr:hypothetical protein ASF13_18550 [Erwinia sp. Leaf53]
MTVERLVNFMRHQYYEADRLTTFVDFYGFQDANGRSASVLENEILQGLVQQGLQAHRIMPYLQMYEFEALLFSDVDKFEYVLDGWNVRVKEQLLTISQQFLTPEAINNHPSTAPSKRILNVFPAGTYSKTIHGPIIAEEIGIDTLRQRCPGFNGWIERLEQWKAMSQP